MPARARQIIAITGFIALLGAIGGAVGGVLTSGLFLLATVFRSSPGAWFVYQDLGFLTAFASTVGAIYGVVLGPLFAWTLLRKAPLWRAIGETALGAALGAGLAVVLAGISPLPFLFALTAAGLAATRLHLAIERSGRAAELSSGAGQR